MSNKSLILINKPEADKAYLGVLNWLIDSIKVDTNQPALDPQFAKAMADSWKEHLKDRHKIPASMLKQLYHDALDYRAKNDVRTHFSVQDMIGAWQRYKDSLQSAEASKNYNSEFCDRCKNSKGWIIASQNGKVIEVRCDHGKR